MHRRDKDISDRRRRAVKTDAENVTGDADVLVDSLDRW